jgi:hypothetical protein
MILAGYEITLRLPIGLRRVEPWYCDSCERFQADVHRGHCDRCYGLLRRSG